MHGILTAGLAHQSHLLGVGVSGKASCIFEQGTYTLVLAHLIVHGAFHLTGDVDQTVVGPNHDDIVVCQTDVAREFSVEDIVVNVHHRNQFVLTIYLDVTECSDFVGSTSHVERMEHGGKGR